VTSPAPDRDDLDGFALDARRAVAAAERAARELGHERVGTEHLLLGLLDEEGTAAAAALSRSGVTTGAVRHKVVEAVGPPSGRSGSPRAPLPRSARAGRALGRSLRFAHQRRADAAATEDLLLGVLDVEGTAGQVLRTLGLDVDRLRADLAPPPASDRSQGDASSPRSGGRADAAGAGDANAAGDATDSRDPDRGARPPMWCPSCGADLEGQAVVRRLTLRGGAAPPREPELVVPVLACGTCATFLGTIPG
jgi:ATP-dependent Clp protease ATP-binding subunit ClpA